tara:strand:- start:241 stop:456 length:216 start_codon:yes stop_codon:yes gene_type:complete
VVVVAKQVQLLNQLNQEIQVLTDLEIQVVEEEIIFLQIHQNQFQLPAVAVVLEVQAEMVTHNLPTTVVQVE